MREEGGPQIVIDELAGLQQRLAAELESGAREAIAARGRFVIALTGGSVAQTFFPALAHAAVDWTLTDFFWIDERAVPPDDPESNYALAATLWLIPARVPASRIHRMRGEDGDLDRAAQIASDELRVVAGNPPCLDLALLGVGEDGHVASIFARRSLGEGGQLVVAVYDSPKPPSRRLTLTMPVLSGARRVVIAALGRSKAAAIRDGLAKDGVTPLAELLRRSQSTLLLLDRDASVSAL
ncbi:MAG TPA: 6-phosphogluconolactonase [Vicinamibacterales bacterium]|nr:6-phosphogluconolactonase [Vicinamibacterales bacterium]